jgi:hypothetical protein
MTNKEAKAVASERYLLMCVGSRRLQNDGVKEVAG